MYKITMHCQKCDHTEQIIVDDEMFSGGVDAEWHCKLPMTWNDDLNDNNNTDIDYE